MANEAIVFDNVSKSFGKTTAVNRVSFTVETGGFFGLLGPNGAGKTTLINMLCSLNKIEAGNISIMGLDVARDSIETRRLLGVVPQELVYDPYFNVLRCLELQSNYYGLRNNRKWIDELLDRLELTDKAKSGTRALSGGMKRRLMIAQSLVHKPPIIVLDEPTAGVDINLRQSLWEFIRELNANGHTILLTTHYLEEAEELCDDIVMMDHGNVIAFEKKSTLLERFKSILLVVRISGGDFPASYAGRIVKAKTNAEKGQYALRLDSYSQIEDFLRDTRQSGLSVDNVEIHNPDLEDIFIDLLGTARRKTGRERPENEA